MTQYPDTEPKHSPMMTFGATVAKTGGAKQANSTLSHDLRRTANQDASLCFFLTGKWNNTGYI